jgi:hypothetical protein
MDLEKTKCLIAQEITYITCNFSKNEKREWCIKKLLGDEAK